jgi:hypothetical protein
MSLRCALPLAAFMVALCSQGVALAESPETLPYRYCKFAVGKLTSCEATPYFGPATVLVQKNYKTCTVYRGRPSLPSCETMREGSVVVRKSRKWVECSVAYGKIKSCKATGFNRAAVLQVYDL